MQLRSSIGFGNEVIALEKKGLENYGKFIICVEKRIKF